MVKKIEEVKDLPGIGPAIAEKLDAMGFHDIMSIAVVSPNQLGEAGLKEGVARKVINCAREAMDMGFITAEQALKNREQIQRITTGVKTFDEMLSGGFETKAISECYGEWGSSKTQIAHQLAINVQLLDPTAVCVYIDTEGSFRTARLLEMCKKTDLNPDEVCKKVFVAKAYNSDHQMGLVHKIPDIIKEGKNVKLVIVDSLTALFRSEFLGRGTLSERQQKINKHMNDLAKLADQYNLCVYVTNQVVTDPNQHFGDPTKSVGGHVVGHRSMFRIYLRKGQKGSRVAKLVDSPNLPDAECAFIVTEEGLQDV